MDKHILIHLTVLCVVALVAIVSVSAMFLQGKSADAGRPAGELGSFCQTDNQCLSGHCDGAIMLPNGRTIPHLNVCT